MNDKRRCELLGITGDYKGGVEYFHTLSAETLQTLIDEGFADPNYTQNDAPSTQDILDFIREYPEFTAIGYAVSPDRPDCRISLEGVEGTVDLKSEAFLKFVMGFRDADEFIIDIDGTCKAWYS